MLSFRHLKAKFVIKNSTHLNDSAEPAGISHITDAHRTVLLSDPVSRAAALSRPLTSLSFHASRILFCTNLKSPGVKRGDGQDHSLIVTAAHDFLIHIKPV